ncbi:MAG: hypothetical protein Q4Q06_05230 [Bacteroidota bacterium]|nr:hypothetical protein [Bacteroidota bacterium]
MKKKRIKFIALVFAIFVCSVALSIPANPKPITIVQPNGKTLTFILKGDERMHWMETLDGYTLLRNENGDLEFACVDENGILQNSGILACNQEERDEIELSLLQTIEPKLFFSSEQLQEK